MRTSTITLVNSLDSNLSAVSELGMRNDRRMKIHIRRIMNSAARYLYANPGDEDMTAILAVCLKYDNFWNTRTPARYAQWYHDHCISCAEKGQKIRAWRKEKARIAAAIERERIEQARVHEKYKDMPFEMAMVELYGEY